ncbi:hypothetical protein BCR33DRAFT_720842 [Rhizoclosmatium globosum]|uniref:WD40 repeat-like protein n=1 Tax=Rhizoclosmatium globosum TaxID=329046 RepID=A0A1Y2BU12_9FUNG|nr:hypothetical protein BCR33DRAFT_720842 [Rhizoclosmatium globosum]|eukprot:ORY38127.1 hypothetical protein BCR33DRAFT_720842 [Rhizoclosmatium globosum]
MVPECYPNYFTTATKMIDGTQVNYDNHNFIWMKGDWKDLGLCEEYSGPVRALDLVQLPDASFLVVGTDYQLYTCPGLSLWFTCTLVPNSGSVKSIEYAPRGNKFIGVGLDDQVYIRIGLLSPWNLVPISGRVVDVTLLTNGVLLGTAWDGTMWTKADQESQWIKVPNGCCVLAVIPKSKPPISMDINPNSNSVINAIPFTTMPLVNLLVGIGPDNSLWGKRADALTNPWTQIPSTMPILDLIEVHGTYMIVGADNKLYFCTSLYINSQCEKQSSGQIKSIAYDFDADQIVGVGMDNQLYVYDYQSWAIVPKSGSVWDISIRNGVIVGVGTDMNVYTRAGLYAPWVLARGFCCVTRVAVLPNGRYGGVGPDYAIYEANPTWTSLPGSKAVVNFANLIHY